MPKRMWLALGALMSVSTIFAPSVQARQCQSDSRIVGGVNTDIKDHPWQVAIDIGGGLCGGSIIAQNWVLTAAHCFAATEDPNGVRIKAGATKFEQGLGATAERVVVHDQYDPVTQEHDIALVKLGIPAAGSAIPLARPDLALKQCDRLEVTGWGRTREGGATSPDLMKATIPFVETGTCNATDAYNGNVLPGMMCAGFDEGGIDACQGDSGGPLVWRGPDGPVLVGVVSWGEGCARKLKYGVYTHVTPYRDWVTGVITGTHAPAQPAARSREATSEQWMKDLVAKRLAVGALHLFKFKDPMYAVTKAIGWKPNAGQPGILSQVEVPEGFVTDLTSIPRVFWGVLPRDGVYAHAAIVHDYLYWQQEVPRQVADDTLRQHMTDLNVDSRVIWTIYTAVRQFGEGAWKANADLKAKGEKRMLKVMPTDPGVTWADWKAKPDVFAP